MTHSCFTEKVWWVGDTLSCPETCTHTAKVMWSVEPGPPLNVVWIIWSASSLGFGVFTPGLRAVHLWLDHSGQMLIPNVNWLYDVWKTNPTEQNEMEGKKCILYSFNMRYLDSNTFWSLSLHSLDLTMTNCFSLRNVDTAPRVLELFSSWGCVKRLAGHKILNWVRPPRQMVGDA